MKSKIFIILVLIISAYASYHMLSIKYASIDKIYIINLDSSTERYAYMEKQLHEVELPVKYERFSAVDGRKVKFINVSTGNIVTGQEILNQHLLLKGEYKIQCEDGDLDYIFGKIEWNYYHPKAVNEIGHACSNRKIWKEAVKNKYKNTMVIEDNISLHDNFTDYLEKAIDNAPKDYDILFLKIANIGKVYKSLAQNHIVRLVMNVFDQHLKNLFWKPARRNIRSAQSYIVSTEGAKKLLECTKKLPTGEMFANDARISKCIEDDKVVAYVSKPQLVFISDRFKTEILE